MTDCNGASKSVRPSRPERRRANRKWLGDGPVITRRQSVIPPSSFEENISERRDDLQSNRYYTALVSARRRRRSSALRRHRINDDVTADVIGASLRTRSLSARQSIVPLCVVVVVAGKSLQAAARRPSSKSTGLFVTHARADELHRVNIAPTA